MNMRSIRYVGEPLLVRESWLHSLGILLLGAFLGIAFNHISPSGVSWSLSKSPTGVASTFGKSNPPVRTSSLPIAPSADCMRWENLEFRIAQGKAVAIDLRSAAAYESGHVPKSVSYPLDVFGSNLDAPTWQTFLAHVNVHHFVVLYGEAQPTEAMRRFRTRLVDELGYAMVMFAEDGFAGWERRHAERAARMADSESKARVRMAAQAAAPPSATVPTVGIAEAAALPNVLWIDSRPSTAFDAGHIPGAISIPEKSDKAVLERLRADQAADRPIVVYCSGVGCGTSRRLASRLVREFGFTRVHHLPGGYSEWQQTQAAQAATKEGSP